MPVKLFNTLSRSKEDFEPLQAGPVRLYTCGPTVYNYLHIGNYRTYIFEDVLKRVLKYRGYPVRHVVNITDVGHLTSQADEGEDKMEVGAAREGKTAWEIAKFYENTFLEDIKTLNIDFHPANDPRLLNDPENKQPGDILCRATEHIAEQVALVRLLETKGYTYRTSDGIYFDTSKFSNYGRLMGEAHLEGLQEGARVAANPEKKNTTDFALWKFSPAGAQRQMEWESPWGKGFPGWHIECSAMAMKYLGQTLDIHCGGVDHIPIHHSNEIAQSEAATGKPFAKVWMHGEFLLMNKAKMAKSSGGFIRLQDLGEKGFDPLDFRYFCYAAHYRRQLDFSWEALEAAKHARRRLLERFEELRKTADKETGSGKNYQEELNARLCDDLDMPGALGSIWKMLSDKAVGPADALAVLIQAEAVLALGLGAQAVPEQLPFQAQKAFDEYVAARQRKDYAASDVLRKQLVKSGIQVLDTKEGSRWKRL